MKLRFALPIATGACLAMGGGIIGAMLVSHPAASVPAPSIIRVSQAAATDSEPATVPVVTATPTTTVQPTTTPAAPTDTPAAPASSDTQTAPAVGSTPTTQAPITVETSQSTDSPTPIARPSQSTTGPHMDCPKSLYCPTTSASPTGH